MKIIYLSKNNYFNLRNLPPFRNASVFCIRGAFLGLRCAVLVLPDNKMK